MAAPPNPGQGPTPDQIAQMQAALAAEAQKRGMTPQQFQAQQRSQLEAEAKAKGMTMDQYVTKLRADAFQNHQRQVQAQQEQQKQQQQQQAQQDGGVQGEQREVPINNPGAPDPKALALAKWLRTQELKTRTCILNGQRKDMFKVKRALRAIESPAYATASAKNGSNLPLVTASTPAAEILKLLPMSLLALRVTKTDPHEGHSHGPSSSSSSNKPKKRVKGLWTVRIEQQQDILPELHYVFLYEGPQWRQKLYAGLALAGVFAVILFPLWPLKMRIGVWYLSMGMLGLIALFFAMAIFRLILFVATVFTVPPGLWLYPNLFEDVGFFDSFRPVWGWQEDKKAVQKAKRDARKAKVEAKTQRPAPDVAGGSATTTATETGAQQRTAAATPTPAAGGTTSRASKTAMKASVEEAGDSD